MRRRLELMAALSAISLAMGLFVVPGSSASAEEPVTITVVGQYGGYEAELLQAEFDAYAATQEALEIEYWSPGVPGVDWYIEALRGDNPPDVVLLPWPGFLNEYAEEFVPVSDWANEAALRRDYGDYLVDLVSVDGDVVGVPIDTQVKSLVWYKPSVFTENGYEIPTTFQELVDLSDQMIADDQTPWCGHMESGFATGWLGTDWVEDLLLGAEGPSVYDAWVAHDVLFTDWRVEAAFSRLLTVYNTEGFMFERDDVLLRWFGEATPLGDESCLMHKQATFFRSFIEQAGYDPAEFDTFKFPAVNPDYSQAVLGAGGNYAAAVIDSIEVRKLMRFIASPRWGRAALHDTSFWIMANNRFDGKRYTDPQVRDWAGTAQAALEAGVFRFDGSDLMPAAVGAGSFWEGIRDLLSDDDPSESELDAVLQSIDDSWPAP